MNVIILIVLIIFVIFFLNYIVVFDVIVVEVVDVVRVVYVHVVFLVLNYNIILVVHEVFSCNSFINFFIVQNLNFYVFVINYLEVFVNFFRNDFCFDFLILVLIFFDHDFILIVSKILNFRGKPQKKSN